MDHRRQADRPLLHLPALAAIARDPHPIVVIQKAAQVGLTELLVNQACGRPTRPTRGAAM